MKDDKSTPPTTLWPQVLETARTLAGGPETEEDVMKTIRAWATPSDRVSVAIGALRALTPEEAESVCRAYLEEVHAHPPDVSFAGTMAEARDWSAIASVAQLKAILWAAYHRLSRGSKRRFWQATIADAEPEERQWFLVDLWEATTPEERRAFIAKVRT